MASLNVNHKDSIYLCTPMAMLHVLFILYTIMAMNSLTGVCSCEKQLVHLSSLLEGLSPSRRTNCVCCRCFIPAIFSSRTAFCTIEASTAAARGQSVCRLSYSKLCTVCMHSVLYSIILWYIHHAIYHTMTHTPHTPHCTMYTVPHCTIPHHTIVLPSTLSTAHACNCINDVYVYFKLMAAFKSPIWY